MIEINKIYNEDCLITMANMPDKFVNLTITSPGYNMRTRIRNGEYTTREKSEHFSKKYQYFSDDLPIEEFYSLHKQILTELLRVSKVICYNFQIVTGSKEAFFKLIGDFSSQIKDIIIWDKVHGQPAMHEKVLNSCYEMILILEDDNKKGRMIQNAKFERGTMNNVLKMGRGKRIEQSHAAAFPEQLPHLMIKNFSSIGDLIYDPFTGTGTTLKMAILNSRNYIGSEISKEYCEISEKRILETKSDIDNLKGLF